MSETNTATVLFIGDPHFQISNIPEVELFIERMTELALSKKPDLIICAGDLLHTHERLHTLPLNKAYDLINKMRNISKTYVLVGNHDYIQNQQFLTDNHWMNGIKEWNNCVIVDRVITEVINNVMFTFVPYVPPGRFQEALNTLDKKDGIWKNSDCIFAHQEFFGCKMGAIVSVEGDKWPIDYPEIISGHIHSKQRPQTNIYYSGSAMQHAFGESTKNVIPYITFQQNKKDYILDEIDLNLPRKKIIYMDVDNVDDYELPETQDTIKITVSGVYDQFKALKKTKKYKKLIKDGIKVVFKAKKIEHEKQISETIVNETDFTTILGEIVNQQKDTYLYETYELVVNNHSIANKDIVYID
jgi:DNA repair exonuclease SbcCD nuclease subunit